MRASTGRRTGPDPRVWRAAWLAAAAIALTAAAGCGEGNGDDAAPVGEVRVGTVAPLAQCRDWVTADDEERLATIADIRRQVNSGDLEHENAELSDEEAASVFDTACANEFAAGFRLYKLYYRAAAFEPLVPADER